MINRYLKYLTEGFSDRNKSRRVPSPVAAYEIMYNKPAPSGMTGQYPNDHKTKNWNGMNIDGHLRDKWINELNSIKQIEVRATCEGHNEQWLSYVAFRVLPNKESDSKYLEKIKKFLNVGITKCDYQLGQQGRPRFIVVGKTWYKHSAWKLWWSTISKRIQEAVR